MTSYRTELFFQQESRSLGKGTGNAKRKLKEKAGIFRQQHYYFDV